MIDETFKTDPFFLTDEDEEEADVVGEDPEDETSDDETPEDEETI